jgi:hypothetical protein
MMKVEVKASHIANGIPFKVDGCALALAIRDATGKPCQISASNLVHQPGMTGAGVPLPAAAAAWREVFDFNDPPGSRATCQSFSFEIKLEPKPQPAPEPEPLPAEPKAGQASLFGNLRAFSD